MIAQVFNEGRVWRPVLAALLLAGAGFWAGRRRPAWRPVAAACAVLGGWASMLATPAAAWSPHTLPDRLPLAAAGGVAAALVAARLPRWQRWAGAGGCLFAAWWLAGGVRPEFWRVLFGVCAAAWLLRRLGAGTPAAACAVGLTALSGVILSGAPWPYATALAVLVCACASAAAPPAATLAAGLAATALGAGSLARGRVGLVDAACLVALAAPLALPSVARRLPRRAAPAAPLGVAAAGLTAAWVVMRVLR